MNTDTLKSFNFSEIIHVSFKDNLLLKSSLIPSNDILCSFSNSYSSSSSLGMKSGGLFSALGIQNILITILSKFTQYNLAGYSGTGSLIIFCL